MEKPERGFSSRSLEELAAVFFKHKVQYLIIGKSGAIVYGFPDTTQDVLTSASRTKINCF